MSLIVLLAPMFLSGCKGPTTTYSGYDMSDRFPLDGDRVWEFANESKPYGLRVEMDHAFVEMDDSQVHTFEFFDRDAGDLLMSMKWSSDSIHGVRLWGYEVVAEEPTGGDSNDTGTPQGASGPLESFEFDPPITFADRKMVPGDTTETETGGMTFTSTFAYEEECPNHLVSGDLSWSCLRMDLDDGDGDPTSGLRIAGTYWIASRYTWSWFQFSGDADKWILTDFEWTAED